MKIKLKIISFWKKKMRKKRKLMKKIKSRLELKGEEKMNITKK
jgi:hypothetical protein